MPHRTRRVSYCTDHEWRGRSDCVHCSIRGMMLFSQLPEHSFGHLLQPIDNQHYPPDSILYREDQQGDAVFSIRRGLVKLLCEGVDGGQRIVRLLGRGDVAGLEVLDKGVRYRHTAVAVGDVDLCSIPLVTLKDLERQHPELCNRLRQQLQAQVNRADHWIKHLNTGVARVRIAHLLLLLTTIAADRNGDIELLPRDDMAAVCGVTKETASRIVAEFKRDGWLVKVAPNTFRVTADKLQQMIDEDASSA